MKKLIIIAYALTICFMAAAQEHLRERVFLTTDKSVYVAGDDLWCSAFCLDVNAGTLSGFSEIAYVEIHSTDGMVQTGKIALDKGRGAGRIDIPNTVPTGNYRIFAYTAQAQNEDGMDYLLGAKTISIFNTFSSARVAGGVDVVERIQTTPALPQHSEGGLALRTSSPSDGMLPVHLENNGPAPVSISLSVYHDDGIPAPENEGIDSFVAQVKGLSPSKGFTMRRMPEYEGEVIRAKVAGASPEDIPNLDLKSAFLSSPNISPVAFSGTIKGGEVMFVTDNVYGDKDLFLEIEDLDDSQVCHLELESPFVNVPVKDVPSLALCQDYASRLQQRGTSMQIAKMFDADTLYSFLPDNEMKILDGDRIRYNLDDYTRFPVMDELFIEFISELRARRIDGKREIQVRMEDSFHTMYFPSGASLMMVDGIPVLDHEKILSYDPLLVHYVDIYPYTYFLGSRVFCGVVNFITYKGNLPGMNFSDNVRVVSYQGAAVPQAFTCEGVDGTRYPDYRQTIYWHPVLSLEPGESIDLKCKTPAYGGRFGIVAEGLDSGCNPVKATSSVEL